MLCATGFLPALDDFAHQIGGIIDHARTTDRRLGHHRLARNMIIAEPRVASRAARLGVGEFRSLFFGCGGVSLASKNLVTSFQSDDFPTKVIPLRSLELPSTLQRHDPLRTAVGRTNYYKSGTHLAFFEPIAELRAHFLQLLQAHSIDIDAGS